MGPTATGLRTVLEIVLITVILMFAYKIVDPLGTSRPHTDYADVFAGLADFLVLGSLFCSGAAISIIMLLLVLLRYLVS